MLTGLFLLLFSFAGYTGQSDYGFNDYLLSKRLNYVFDNSEGLQGCSFVGQGRPKSGSGSFLIWDMYCDRNGHTFNSDFVFDYETLSWVRGPWYNVK